MTTLATAPTQRLGSACGAAASRAGDQEAAAVLASLDHFMGLTAQQIARRTGLPPAVVGVHLLGLEAIGRSRPIRRTSCGCTWTDWHRTTPAAGGPIAC